ncbi:MAG: hypothetical protein ABFD46_08925 [Armatimonadota bacterium]
MRLVFIVWIMIALFAVPVLAADWPETMELGGFTISNIKGSSDADGSGRATGNVAVPGGGNCRIDLSRSSAGLVIGSTRTSFNVGGVRIDGSFMLDRRGLQGTGTVQTQGQPICDANLVVEPGKGITGNGVVRLCREMPVKVSYAVDQQGVTANGFLPCRASIETPLAVYTFKGNIEVSASGADIKIVAKGNIERTGRIGGMSSAFGPLVFNVNPASGQANVNVGGADITIDLW